MPTARSSTRRSFDPPVDMSKASGDGLQRSQPRQHCHPVLGRRRQLLWRRGDVAVIAWGDLADRGRVGEPARIDVPIANGATGMVIDRFIAVAKSNGQEPDDAIVDRPGPQPASTNTANSRPVLFTRNRRAASRREPPRSPAATSRTPTAAPCHSRARRSDAPCASRAASIPRSATSSCARPRIRSVLGVGNAAMRDVISFFRYREKDDAGTPIRSLSGSKYVIGFWQLAVGTLPEAHAQQRLQRGRGRAASLDGMNPNIAGMMGSFNIRFMQPGDIAELYFPGADGPLWWRTTPTRCAAVRSGACSPLPRDQYLPAHHGDVRRSEAWYSRGTVGMAGTKGTEDLPLPANVRRYYHAGTTHGGGGEASTSARPRPTRTHSPPIRIRSARSIVRCTSRWSIGSSRGRLPPPSRYPKVSDGTLVQATSRCDGLARHPERTQARRRDELRARLRLRRAFNYNDGSGVILNVPPPVRRVIPTLAPKVDADGNEIAGIRSCSRACRSGRTPRGIPSGGPLEGTRSLARRRLHPVRQDEGRAHGERRSAPVDRGAVPGPGSTTCTRWTRRT